MADWKDRAEILGDVAFFRYSRTGQEKSAPLVFVWDLDKTYLDTAIDSLSGLLQTILERAFKKKNVPGTDTLLRGLADSFHRKVNENYFPIYFITASPPQMEERILEKLRFDNLKPFGCFFKDNLKNIRPKRLWRLTKQVGFKLQALLQLRVELGESTKQICWGDDSESDAIIYNLYSDLCARRLTPNDLRRVLEKLHVTGEQVDTILQLQSKVPPVDPVQRVYINLATDTDADYYLKFGRRTLATTNTFQVAMDLFQNELIDLEILMAVIQDMTTNYGFTLDELMKSFEDLLRRNALDQKNYELLKAFFVDQGILRPSFEAPFKLVGEDSEHSEPWVQDRVDYLHDYR